MLAPRKNLWPTPIEIIDKAIELLNLTENDIVFDIGAGDGRFLFRICELTNCQVIGIEIIKERCDEINNQIIEKNLNERCKIICDNALEINYENSTAFFIYLIPRGISILYDKIFSKKKGKFKIISFMNPLPIKSTKKIKNFFKKS